MGDHWIGVQQSMAAMMGEEFVKVHSHIGMRFMGFCGFNA